MAEEKNSFILYSDVYETVSCLDNERAGILFKTILEYVNDLDPEPDDLLVKMAFIPIKASLKRDLKKWEGNKEKKSKSGSVGNLKRWHLDLYESYSKGDFSLEKAIEIAESRKSSHCDKVRKDAIAPVSQDVANIAVSVSVSDSVSVSVSDSVTLKETPTPFVEVEKTSPGIIDFDFSELHIETETLFPEVIVPAKESKNAKSKKEQDYDKALKKAISSFESTECNFTSASFKNAWIDLLMSPKWKKKTQSAIDKSLKQILHFEEAFATKLAIDSEAKDYQGIVYEATEQNYKKWQQSQNTGLTTNLNQNGNYPLNASQDRINRQQDQLDLHAASLELLRQAGL